LRQAQMLAFRLTIAARALPSGKKLQEQAPIRTL